MGGAQKEFDYNQPCGWWSSQVDRVCLCVWSRAQLCLCIYLMKGKQICVGVCVHCVRERRGSVRDCGEREGKQLNPGVTRVIKPVRDAATAETTSSANLYITQLLE